MKVCPSIYQRNYNIHTPEGRHMYQESYLPHYKRGTSLESCDMCHLHRTGNNRHSHNSVNYLHTGNMVSIVRPFLKQKYKLLLSYTKSNQDLKCMSPWFSQHIFRLTSCLHF